MDSPETPRPARKTARSVSSQEDAAKPTATAARAGTRQTRMDDFSARKGDKDSVVNGAGTRGTRRTGRGGGGEGVEGEGAASPDPKAAGRKRQPSGDEGGGTSKRAKAVPPSPAGKRQAAG